ncbi:uncharacterized protein YALI1_E37083g [Yarrowia lipolytica]|uniref:Uncharacterized protein n=1 Tax=Yarrowia lipolytica TaxID=4952 RepID=A0A1D8NKS0_YARLL|nr:hypothetical protein YALI1_E37083g [Yarrowia lipolytica]
MNSPSPQLSRVDVSNISQFGVGSVGSGLCQVSMLVTFSCNDLSWSIMTYITDLSSASSGSSKSMTI